jgi:nicotinamidase-related amidase
MASNPLATRAVLLIVDHLVDVAPMGHTAPAQAVDETVAALADLAKLYDIPIVFSGMGTAPQPTPALRKALGDDVKIHVRQTTDSFDDNAIRGAIESTGRKTVLIAGIITEIAAQRAALGGKQRGFDTHVVFDACNGSSKRSEDAAMHCMAQAGVVLSSLPAVIGELAVDFSDPRTGKTFAPLSQLAPA